MAIGVMEIFVCLKCVCLFLFFFVSRFIFDSWQHCVDNMIVSGLWKCCWKVGTSEGSTLLWSYLYAPPFPRHVPVHVIYHVHSFIIHVLHVVLVLCQCGGVRCGGVLVVHPPLYLLILLLLYRFACMSAMVDIICNFPKKHWLLLYLRLNVECVSIPCDILVL